MRHWALSVFYSLTLTFGVVHGLTESDGYNIGVVLGSVVAALLAVGIAAFVFYMFCIRRWLGIGEPAELGYTRQNDQKLKKPKSGPSKFSFGTQSKAAPYGGGGGAMRDIGRRQGGGGATNEVYEQSRPTSNEEMRAGGRPGYEVTRSSYQQRTYASSGGGSPLSAAYLGTGV